MHYLEIVWEWGLEETKEFSSLEDIKAFQKRNPDSIYMSHIVDKPKKEKNSVDYTYSPSRTMSDYEMDVLL